MFLSPGRQWAPYCAYHTLSSMDLLVISAAQSHRVLLWPFVSYASPPSGQLPRAVCAGWFSSTCNPTNPFHKCLVNCMQLNGFPCVSTKSRHLCPSTPQATCVPIALSIFRRATFYIDLPVAYFEGRLPRVWRQSLGSETNVVPPPNGAAPPSTLSRKGDGNENPQRKYYIITAERTKYSWLYGQGMGPLQNNIGGAPVITWIMYKVSVNVQTNPQPHSNTPRTVPWLCHSMTFGHNAQHNHYTG